MPRSVAIDGDTLVVGAHRRDTNGKANSGAVYIFTRSGGVWTQDAVLVASGVAKEDNFGKAVDIDGDTILIGAPQQIIGKGPGSAYVFTHTPAGWTEQERLVPQESHADDAFGFYVSLDGDTAVIGAHQHTPENGPSMSGAAFVFTRNGTTWSQQAGLLPDTEDRALKDFFGSAVSLDGDTVLIGAYGVEVNATKSGAAYIFTRSGSTWSQQSKIWPDDGALNDMFGRAGAFLSGDTAVIGARHHDDTGAAYVFTWNGSTWGQQAEIRPCKGSTGGKFGNFIFISNGTAFIGAYTDSDPTRKVYVYDLRCKGCPVDINDDGVVNTQDVIDFLSAWANGDPVADWNKDCIIDTDDTDAYFYAWSVGC